MKEFADDNFKFDENGKKVIRTGRKHCWKRRNCSLRAISPFPTVFSKDCFPEASKGVIVWEWFKVTISEIWPLPGHLCLTNTCCFKKRLVIIKSKSLSDGLRESMLICQTGLVKKLIKELMQKIDG